MAPDINSLPPSPYRNTSSTSRRPSEPRRLSERMASPSSSLFTSTPPPRSPTSAAFSTINAPPPREDNTGVDPGPGPLRHPRPLTAADLHMQLEKEQEGIVNRLTRELTALRAQTASTTSNTSSASAEQTEGNPAFLSSGSSIHPSSSRRHRSSSNLSSRGGASGPTAAGAGSTSTVNAATTSGIAPPRDSSYSNSYTRSGGDPLSRQSSVASSRRSDVSSSLGVEPSPSHHRHSHSNSLSTPGGPVRGGSFVSGTHRYDEAAQARAELEMVKAENEALKGRIRELERAARRGSVANAGEEEGNQGAGRRDPGLGLGR